MYRFECVDRIFYGLLRKLYKIRNISFVFINKFEEDYNIIISVLNKISYIGNKTVFRRPNKIHRDAVSSTILLCKLVSDRAKHIHKYINQLFAIAIIAFVKLCHFGNSNRPKLGTSHRVQYKIMYVLCDYIFIYENTYTSFML